MKTMYEESNKEGEQHGVGPAEPIVSGNEPSGSRDGASGSEAAEEEVVMEDIIE